MGEGWFWWPQGTGMRRLRRKARLWDLQNSSSEIRKGAICQQVWETPHAGLHAFRMSV